MPDEMWTIEINGTPVQVRPGAMIIHAADEAGIQIPRFCYHKKLSIAANCRMCLVEVEKAPKPLPACATPVSDGMKVYTKSPLALQAQQATMEFLLINHPLDCPICDQGGECELQDVAMGYGEDVSRYTEGKRVVQDQDLGPLIATDMTRCIHCTRCVRFGAEIAGIRELGATGRGEHMRIGTYIERTVDSELSGNVIDVCPVGALTAKPSRYSARAWELTQYPSIAAHDCVGSHIYLHAFRGQVNRVVPRDEEAINECWLADRDRFSYQGLNCESRLTVPMIKRDGEWQECDWETALEAAVLGLQEVRDKHGADQIACLASPSATLEEHYLLNLLLSGLGCANIDHRLRQADFSDQDRAPLFPWLGQSIADLEHTEAALLVGTDVQREQPLIAHRLRKASMRGAKISLLYPRRLAPNFAVAEQLQAGPAGLVQQLAAIATAVYAEAGQALPEVLRGFSDDAVEPAHQTIARSLLAAERATLLLGEAVGSHPYLSSLRALAALIAAASDAKLGYLSMGANAAGAHLAGVLPHRAAGMTRRKPEGLDALAMLRSPRKAYVLHQVEPEADCWDPALALEALRAAKCVVALTAYRSTSMLDYADVLLPVATFAETPGTFVNVEGKWQSFSAGVRCPGESRPAWKVLRVLGNLFKLDGFDFMSAEQVREALRDVLGPVEPDNRLQVKERIAVPGVNEGELLRIGSTAPYCIDAVVRRAQSLQATGTGQDTALRINTAMARKLGLEDASRVLVRQGATHTSMPMTMDDAVVDACVWIPAGTEYSAKLGPATGPVELEAD